MWLRIHLSNHPSFPKHSSADLILLLWEQLAEANVLLAPGYIFDAASLTSSSDQIIMGKKEDLRIADNGDGYFRLSFSTATKDEMKQATRIFARVTKEFFENELL